MSFKNTPIRRKLMTMILLTSGIVLLFTCSSFFIYEFVTFRQTSIRHLTTVGEVIAANSTAALAFDNKDDAREILSALQVEKDVVAGALYDKTGKLFCIYPEGISAGTFPPTVESEGY